MKFASRCGRLFECVPEIRNAASKVLHSSYSVFVEHRPGWLSKVKTSLISTKTTNTLKLEVANGNGE